MADENIFTLENPPPMGSNDAPLVFNFSQRMRYRNAAYFEGLPKPIDTLYDKIFYGKVDRYQNVIVPKKDSDLIAQASTEQNVFAFDFVADAFFQLRRNLTIAGDSGNINRNTSVFYNLQATRGWFDYEKAYRPVLRRLIAAHAGHLTTLDKKDFNKIVTISDYTMSLINYIKTGAYKLPISLTEFILSSGTAPGVSGLSIATAEDHYGDDLNKYSKYFMDPNFAYYVRAARKFGFYVDRNAPWRLFADVFSTPMAGSGGVIEAAGHVTGDIQKNFFNSYYDRTYALDVPLLKSEILSGFNNFAQINERITETVSGLTKRGISGGAVGSVGCGAPTSIATIGFRDPTTAEALDALGDPFWFDFYFNIRMLESGIHYKNSRTLIQEAIKVAGVYDFNQGLLYINNLFKPYLYDQRILKNPLTQEDQTVRVGTVLDAPTVVVGY